MCPSFYVGVVLLVRERMPHLDSRLWLDGIVAALTTGAISAALVFGALQVSTGGDPAAVATNLAYPLGDMILLASVIGAMAAGRSRLDRSWLWFGAGIAAFAVSDSVYLLQIAKDTYVGDTLLDIGWLVAGLLVGIAAWQPSVRRRSTGDELPSIIAPTVLALASLALLVYDHFHPDQPARRRAVGRGAGGGADPPVAHAPREPLQPGHDPRAGAHRLAHRARQPLRPAARAGATR